LQQEVEAFKNQEKALQKNADDLAKEIAARKKTEQVISKETISINPKRQALFHSNEPFNVLTTLGKANKKDIKFGLSIMKEKRSISEQESAEIAKILSKIDTGSQISVTEREKLKKVGRLGLAFQTRLRMTGTIS